MAAARKKTEGTPSKWAQLVKEATADYTPIPPYVLDAEDPPIVITPPDTAERVFAMAELATDTGRLSNSKLKAYMQVLCGDEFERVWDLVKNQPMVVVQALLEDISEHFSSAADASADDAPGGE